MGFGNHDGNKVPLINQMVNRRCYSKAKENETIIGDMIRESKNLFLLTVSKAYYDEEIDIEKIRNSHYKRSGISYSVSGKASKEEVDTIARFALNDHLGFVDSDLRNNITTTFVFRKSGSNKFDFLGFLVIASIDKYYNSNIGLSTLRKNEINKKTRESCARIRGKEAPR